MQNDVTFVCEMTSFSRDINLLYIGSRAPDGFDTVTVCKLEKVLGTIIFYHFFMFWFFYRIMIIILREIKCYVNIYAVYVATISSSFYCFDINAKIVIQILDQNCPYLLATDFLVLIDLKNTLYHKSQ